MSKKIIFTGLLVLFAGSAVRAERYELMTGVDARLTPGTPRNVPPFPMSGVFPQEFSDGDRLAGTGDVGTEEIAYLGEGDPILAPNEFGTLSFTFRRGSVPIPGLGQAPLMGIDFLGGPLLDLDGDALDMTRSLVPVTGETAVLVSDSFSYIDLTLSGAEEMVLLDGLEATGTNEAGPGVDPGVATTITTIAGTNPDASVGDEINPTIDTRVGTLTAYEGNSGTLSGVWRIENLGYELWQDSITPFSSSSDTLGTFQFLGTMWGWVIERDPDSGAFPTLAGEGLGTTIWPMVDVGAVGTVVNTSGGGTATIVTGSAADDFATIGGGGLALTDAGGDLGAYFDNVVIPLVDADAPRFVYLEGVGFGVNNSFDPVFGDSIGYDVVIIAQSTAPLSAGNGDCDDDGDVDLADFGEFQVCFTGPDAPYAAGCACSDFDGDGDVDLTDFGAFQVAFTGSL